MIDTYAICLGAFGCGRQRHPPQKTAELWAIAITRGEFRARFRHIIFAIHDANLQPASGSINDNFSIYQRVFQGHVQQSQADVEMGGLGSG